MKGKDGVGGGGLGVKLILLPPEKTTLKKPSLIRVKGVSLFIGKTKENQKLQYQQRYMSYKSYIELQK